MNTITIQVENKSTLEGLKKVLKAMNGVVILPNKRNKESGLEEALTDVRESRVTEYGSAEEMLLLLLNTGTHSDIF